MEPKYGKGEVDPTHHLVPLPPLDYERIAEERLAGMRGRLGSKQWGTKPPSRSVKARNRAKNRVASKSRRRNR